MLLTLAWRNLWRQKRRTILTASALALALFLSLSMRSLQEGTYQNSIDNSARLSTGLIQLQHPEFGESNSIDDLVSGTEEFIAPIKDDEAITNLLPRIESFALAAAKDKSKGIMVVGVEPDLEDQYSSLGKKVSQSTILKPESSKYWLENLSQDTCNFPLATNWFCMGKVTEGRQPLAYFLFLESFLYPFLSLRVSWFIYPSIRHRLCSAQVTRSRVGCSTLNR